MDWENIEKEYITTNATYKEVKKGLEEVKEARAASKERLQDRGNINWYSVIVFEDEEQKKQFYKKISVPIFEEYLSFDKVLRLEKS